MSTPSTASAARSVQKGQPLDITEASATALAAAIRARAISSAELIEACLRRIEAVNPMLNAVVQLRSDAARADARAADTALARGGMVGPLHGVPVTIKDAYDVAGTVSTGGTLGRRSFVPQEDAVAVARLRAAGAVVLGKTNVPELSLSHETDNLVYGRTNNPYDLARTPGGSSGGEVAIIAAGGSPLGLGTDAAGSIRVPAHFCGLAGLRPTSGRVPLTGAFPPAVFSLLPATTQVGGPLARRVEDLGLTLSVVAGEDWRDPRTAPVSLGDATTVNLQGTRVAVYSDNGVIPATTETAAVLRRAADCLADTGAALEEAKPTGIEQAFELFMSLAAADGGAGIVRQLESAGTTNVGEGLERLLERMRGSARSSAEVLELLLRLDQFRTSMSAFFQGFDAIVCPAAAFPAPAHGAASEPRTALGMFSYAVPYNLTDWPAVVVRGGTSAEGLPIGVQVVAHPWREDVALALAKRLEALCGFLPPPAPVQHTGGGHS
jgi:amidase